MQGAMNLQENPQSRYLVRWAEYFACDACANLSNHARCKLCGSPTAFLTERDDALVFVCWSCAVFDFVFCDGDRTVLVTQWLPESQIGFMCRALDVLTSLRGEPPVRSGTNRPAARRARRNRRREQRLARRRQQQRAKRS
jgi:hypothetical protein